MAVAAPEPVTVTRWRCRFCHRSRSSKRLAAEHIARCWLNPAVRGCKTCQHYERVPDCPGSCDAPPPHPGCEDGYEDCAAGVDIDGGLETDCPLWVLRVEVSDE